MNRRDFNRLGATAALSFAANAGYRAQFDYPWKLGIITDEVDPDLTRVLSSFYPKYDLHWAEIRNLQLDGKSQYVYKTATPEQLKHIKQQLDGAGVKMSVLDTGIYKITLPGTQPVGENARDLNPVQGEYDRQLEDLKRAADAAHALGTERVRIFTFKRVADPNAIFDRIVDNLHKAIEIAKQHDVTLLVENEFDCNTGTGAETAKLFRAIPDRRLMHNWDPGNCFEAGEQPFPKAWDQIDHSRISHIHLKDSVDHQWKPIGSGEIDFVGQFKALKAMNYSGTMSLETHYKNARNDPYTSSVESMDGLISILKRI
ncbi:MAG: sugar phosphate isomerase/epimerase [Acidobacteriaceae bacterium]|nr:sugar phosphate isomerase/epimerase [Acidobacteriaceae bacterium]MBV9294855.1 sugar phosphate isomerase/epimerase [Acidobacteriaceae bacterium]MBV9765958.1 sugar phosphate isomerase/epimerase [Acidobacteriaceae bacterium]